MSAAAVEHVPAGAGRDNDHCRCRHGVHLLGGSPLSACESAAHPAGAWIPLAMGFTLTPVGAVCDLCAYAGHLEGGRGTVNMKTEEGQEARDAVERAQRETTASIARLYPNIVDLYRSEAYRTLVHQLLGWLDSEALGGRNGDAARWTLDVIATLADGIASHERERYREPVSS